MRRWLLFFLLFSVFAASAADPFRLPEKTTVIHRDESGKTWAFNGMLNASLAETKKLLKDAILKSGFKFKYEIPMDEKGKEHVILSFVKKKETLILMLWTDDGKKTFFSYGISR